jgi:hypothetical protein
VKVRRAFYFAEDCREKKEKFRRLRRISAALSRAAALHVRIYF